jgi:hypothetical protein
VRLFRIIHCNASTRLAGWLPGLRSPARPLAFGFQLQLSAHPRVNRDGIRLVQEQVPGQAGLKLRLRRTVLAMLRTGAVPLGPK